MSTAMDESGEILEQSADSLLRIWRLARVTAHRDVFPGLLDGVMGDFFARLGRLLSKGTEPEEVWRGVAGLVRWTPQNAAARITGEWAVAMEVLTAACESFNAVPDVGGWLARAVAEAEKGTASLREAAAKAPDGVVTILVFGETHAPRRGRGANDD